MATFPLYAGKGGKRIADLILPDDEADAEMIQAASGELLVRERDGFRPLGNLGEEPVRPLPPPSAHAHCWHLAKTQHLVPNHRDDVCCHCGKPRCVHLPDAAEGHGPYSPD